MRLIIKRANEVLLDRDWVDGNVEDGDEADIIVYDKEQIISTTILWKPDTLVEDTHDLMEAGPYVDTVEIVVK